MPGGFLTLKGESQGFPRGIQIGGSGVGEGRWRWSCCWLAVLAAHQWSGCGPGTVGTVALAGEEEVGKELVQETAQPQETPSVGRGP